MSTSCRGTGPTPPPSKSKAACAIWAGPAGKALLATRGGSGARGRADPRATHAVGQLVGARPGPGPAHRKPDDITVIVGLVVPLHTAKATISHEKSML